MEFKERKIIKKDNFIVIDEESPNITSLNEMLFRVHDSLPTKIENSIFYPKLKHLLHGEIIRFCREYTDLRQDLNILRMNVGQALPEAEVREYLNSLKTKYNGEIDDIGIDYHIEFTKIDYSAAVFVIIKRGIVQMKKFVFRFRKSAVQQSMDNISIAGIPIEKEDSRKERQEKYVDELINDKK
jgi:hypothetical protein